MQEVMHVQIASCPDPAPRPRMCAELAAQNATLVLDAGGTIRWCSDSARQLLGRAGARAIGRPIAAFVPTLALNEDTPGYNAAYVAFTFGEDRLRTCDLLAGTEDAFTADLSVSPFRLGEDGMERRGMEQRGFVVAIHRGCEPMLARIDMQRFIDSVAIDEDPVLVADATGVVVHANPAFETLTGFIRAEVLGVHADTLTSEAGSGRFEQRSAWLGQGRHVRGTTTCLRRDTTRVPVDESMRPFVDAQGRVTHYVLRLRDATERVAAAERVAWLAHHDPLTGIANRALFADRLQQEIARAGRHGTGFALLCLDIDGFKLINDRHGHAAGDETLRQVAQRLREVLREEDTVARLGGDEFAVLLPNVRSRAEVEALCRSVAPRLTSGLQLEGNPIALTMSAGVGCFPFDGREADELIRAADRAMYSAKRAGGNRVHFAGHAH